MSINKYLIYMTIGTLISWAGWFLVVIRINPQEAGFLAFLFFYLTLLFSLTGTLSIIGFYIRKIFLKKELIFKHVLVSFRQAVLFSILVVGVLFLQGRGLLTWWNVILLIVALAVLEFFFISFKSSVEQ